MTTTADPALSRGSTADWAPRAVLDTMHSVFVARAIYAVVRLGVFEELSRGGPRSVTELAQVLGAQPVPLHQIVRATATTGALRTVPGTSTGPDGVVELTPSGEAMLEGHPSGTRDLVLTMQGAIIQDSISVLPERVTSGLTGPQITRDKGFFDVLRDDPAAAASFDRMMGAIHGDEPAAVAAACDLGWASTVVDVGGGQGGMLATLLRHSDHLRGTVFDLPDVAPNAERYLAGAGVGTRADAVGGSFFDSVTPHGADAYVLSHVLHDWDDDSCVTILRHCADAMHPGSRLLVVEMVLPPGDDPHPGKILDLVMVTLTHGRERTAAEYGELLARAGLRMTTVTPTDSPVSVVEAVHSGY